MPPESIKVVGPPFLKRAFGNVYSKFFHHDHLSANNAVALSLVNCQQVPVCRCFSLQISLRMPLPNVSRHQSNMLSYPFRSTWSRVNLTWYFHFFASCLRCLEFICATVLQSNGVSHDPLWPCQLCDRYRWCRCSCCILNRPTCVDCPPGVLWTDKIY